ncbi:MAG TPA: glycosyltransferase family 1 protein [Acidimicrobiales bacterium]|nr:glycosyltransferase family 1 protein [Acidimicrobiales bacterium]
MKVGCNLLWLVPGNVGGTETATVAMLREIAASPSDDVELVLFALDAFGQTYPDLVAAFPSHLVPLSGRMRGVRVAAENSWLARQGRDVDVVHHMGGTLPMVQGVPGVLTIHDLQPFDMPENFTITKRTYLQRSIPRSVRRAAGVIAPSEFVRRGIVDRFGVDPARVHLAPWGVEPPTTQVSVAQVQARYGLPRRWFVFPSFTWNHKNHGLLLRAFATVAAREHDVMLVLTGGEGPAEHHVRDQVAAMGLRGRVRRTGLIPRRDVLAIVRGAVALTWPSRYEGFGLPVLEAMSLGTPVLSSDAAALPEVTGGAATLLGVDDPQAWDEAMTRMLQDGGERARLAAAGREHVAAFTWRRTADATLDAYRAALPAPSTAIPEEGAAP